VDCRKCARAGKVTPRKSVYCKEIRLDVDWYVATSNTPCFVFAPLKKTVKKAVPSPAKKVAKASRDVIKVGDLVRCIDSRGNNGLVKRTYRVSSIIAASGPSRYSAAIICVGRRNTSGYVWRFEKVK
jgi:hypothetical protein